MFFYPKIASTKFEVKVFESYINVCATIMRKCNICLKEYSHKVALASLFGAGLNLLSKLQKNERKKENWRKKKEFDVD